MVLVSLLLLLGCSSTKQGGPNQARPIIWPPPPEQPRITYVRDFARPADLGIKRSPLGRIATWITGSDKGNEPLVKPFGLALDEQDNLCLTDTGANVVCYWNRAKNQWSRWAQIGPVPFVSPVAIAKRNGVFYVADSGLAGVLAFNGRGELLFQITNHLSRPSGLAILAEQLFVVDSQRHAVLSFDLAGGYRFEFGRRGTGPGEFNYPSHVAADPAGRLFVTDSMNGRVQIFDAEGQFKAQLGRFGDRPGFFSRPKGVAVDSLGHVYVADGLFDNIQIFDEQARFLLNWGDAGTEPGQFWLPNGIAISQQNEIFVADSYNRRVQIFKYIGQP